MENEAAFFCQIHVLILNYMSLFNGYELFRSKDNDLKVNSRGRGIDP